MKPDQRDSLERALWRQQQRPMGPCCAWPQECQPVDRWTEPAPTLPSPALQYVSG